MAQQSSLPNYSTNGSPQSGFPPSQNYSMSPSNQRRFETANSPSEFIANKIECIEESDNNFMNSTTKIEISDENIQRVQTFQGKPWSSNIDSWTPTTTITSSSKIEESAQLLSPRNYMLSCATSSSATVCSIMGYTSPITATTSSNSIPAPQPIRNNELLSPKQNSMLSSPNTLSVITKNSTTPTLEPRMHSILDYGIFK